MLCWMCNEVEVKDIIMDPPEKGGKIRHCHVCEEVIQSCLHSLEKPDDGEVELIAEIFDEPTEEFSPVLYQQGFHSAES